MMRKMTKKMIRNRGRLKMDKCRIRTKMKISTITRKRTSRLPHSLSYIVVPVKVLYFKVFHHHHHHHHHHHLPLSCSLLPFCDLFWFLLCVWLLSCQTSPFSFSYVLHFPSLFHFLVSALIFLFFSISSILGGCPPLRFMTISFFHSYFLSSSLIFFLVVLFLFVLSPFFLLSSSSTRSAVFPMSSSC